MFWSTLPVRSRPSSSVKKQTLERCCRAHSVPTQFDPVRQHFRNVVRMSLVQWGCVTVEKELPSIGLSSKNRNICGNPRRAYTRTDYDVNRFSVK